MSFLTFGDLLDAYLEQHLSGKPAYPYYRRLDRQLFRDWRPLPLSEISRPKVRRLHILLKATPTHADKAVGLVKQAFNWAHYTEDPDGHPYWIGENPAAGIRRYQSFGRIRVLTEVELSRLVMSLDGTMPKIQGFVAMLMTTGCRMSEARETKWEHLDLAQSRWLKPSTKNGCPQIMPLARQAVERLDVLPRRGQGPFMGLYGHCWARSSAEKAWGLYRSALNLDDVWLHDFRRTLASRLYEQERDELLIKACLNHYDGRPIAVYVRLQYDRLARALQRHADGIWALTKEQSDEPSGHSLPRHVPGSELRVSEP